MIAVACESSWRMKALTLPAASPRVPSLSRHEARERAIREGGDSETHHG
jgi:hypothetical protein